MCTFEDVLNFIKKSPSDVVARLVVATVCRIDEIQQGSDEEKASYIQAFLEARRSMPPEVIARQMQPPTVLVVAGGGGRSIEEMMYDALGPDTDDPFPKTIN